MAVLVVLTSAETDKKTAVAETAERKQDEKGVENADDTVKNKRGLHGSLGDYASFGHGGFEAQHGGFEGHHGGFEAHDFGHGGFEGHQGFGGHQGGFEGHQGFGSHQGGFGGHHGGFEAHDYGASEHHHEHVKHITIEKKVPVPYTVTKHIPYTVEKKVCANSIFLLL